MILFAYLSLLFSTILNSLGALFLKKGSKDFKVWKLLNNKKVIFGFFIYLLSTIFFVFAVKFLPISIAYPISSLSYVWVVVFSAFILKEKVKLNNWLGIIIIILGIVLLNLR
ncbi:MAG: hypothetical protein PWP03_720 [Candidatus Woesearchaeota archaeon]|nr:hypothetical protein [Candidatus Woesearchaeota archaeon]